MQTDTISIDVNEIYHYIVKCHTGAFQSLVVTFKNYGTLHFEKFKITEGPHLTRISLQHISIILTPALFSQESVLA